MIHMKKQIFIIIVWIGLLGSGCSIQSDTFNPFISTEKNIQFLVDKGHSHWEKRVNPKDAKMARLFLSKAYDQDPNNGDVSQLYARACHYIGYYVETDPAQSDSLFMEGMKSAWDFIISTDAYQEGFALTNGDSTAKMIGGIENTPQRHYERQRCFQIEKRRQRRRWTPRSKPQANVLRDRPATVRVIP